MAKLTLQGCKHPVVRHWLAEDEPDDDMGAHHATCMVCYERLRRIDAPPSVRWVRDFAAPLCHHTDKSTIQKPPKFQHADHIDALCLDCGVVLRHPEGPGEWEEVVHNGFVIREEP